MLYENEYYILMVYIKSHQDEWRGTCIYTTTITMGDTVRYGSTPKRKRGAHLRCTLVSIYMYDISVCVCMSVFALTKMRGDVAKGCHRAKRSTHTYTHIEWVNELKMGDLVSECSSVWHAIAFHCLHHVLRLLLVSRLPITFHTHTHIYIGLRWVSLERRASGKKSIIAFLPFFLFCSQTASWDLEQWD